MSSMVPPAASTAAFTFWQTWWVCASMSPMPAMVPSGRRDVMPEMNTIRPRASVTVAWEKWPFGLLIFSELICFLGMASSLMGRLAQVWFNGTVGSKGQLHQTAQRTDRDRDHCSDRPGANHLRGRGARLP